MHAFKCSILTVGAFAWMVNPVRAHQLNPSQADSYEVLQDSRGIVRPGEILVGVANNIGAIVKRSDSNGFHIGIIGRTYCAVRHEAIVVLLETHDQEETMMVIADKLFRANW